VISLSRGAQRRLLTWLARPASRNGFRPLLWCGQAEILPGCATHVILPDRTGGMCWCGPVLPMRTGARGWTVSSGRLANAGVGRILLLAATSA